MHNNHLEIHQQALTWNKKREILFVFEFHRQSIHDHVITISNSMYAL